jgi:hypothetical protein
MFLAVALLVTFDMQSCLLVDEIQIRIWIQCNDFTTYR